MAGIVSFCSGMMMVHVGDLTICRLRSDRARMRAV